MLVKVPVQRVFDQAVIDILSAHFDEREEIELLDETAYFLRFSNGKKTISFLIPYVGQRIDPTMYFEDIKLITTDQSLLKKKKTNLKEPTITLSELGFALNDQRALGCLVSTDSLFEVIALSNGFYEICDPSSGITLFAQISTNFARYVSIYEMGESLTNDLKRITDVAPWSGIINVALSHGSTMGELYIRSSRKVKFSRDDFMKLFFGSLMNSKNEVLKSALDETYERWRKNGFTGINLLKGSS